MIKRAFLKLAGTTAVAAVLATGALAQEVTLRMHQFLPAQANVPKNVLVPWAERVMEASGGRIEIQHFPSMQLGGTPPQLIDQAIDGVADIVWTVAGYTPGRFPRAEVFELPFTMTDAGDMSAAYWELAEEQMMDQDFADFKVLGVWVHGPGVIHSADPIESPEDLNGVKLRAPTRVTTKLFGNLGATTVGMPVPAIPESLSKGVVDGAVIPWEVVGALKVAELVENHTEFEGNAIYTTSFIFAMNRDAYEALPDDLKAVIDDNSGLEFSRMAGAQMQSDDGPSREAALDAGNNVITISEEAAAPWRAAAEATTAEWIAEMNEKGIDAEALIARKDELLEKHNTQ
ncbi:TRAP transporter substrate-binding protein [Marivita hallyeonensis]|uniref:TRAP-type C4-dicarboxylate transport system, substrate-binding protein n=1 Tax=Marivita hallyeonensis TaxID=996342 RepID=A0A1M5R3K0_9RHOB|nr:TRAP transporter substrate-binding protein [Marivita hallyeonensis]SHH20686.1 TRAP-type C4-dicarboxylate transport system, substrate-binding protein [Marivita hallyeonensis]